MKSVAGPIVTAVIFAVVGFAFWTAGQTERRLAEMHQRVALLQYSAALNEGEDEEGFAMAQRLPRVGDALAADSRGERATAQYWRGEYIALEPKRDAGGAVTESDPGIALLSADAEFRGAQHASDRNDAVRRLDRAVKTYSDVLKINPSTDTAYNYEYVVRVRDIAQKQRPAAPAKADAAKAPRMAATEPASDLPAGPTLHGLPGAPPKGTDMAQFKIVIPKRGEERKDNPEAGKGGGKIRKG
jgi:hypothetical protein